MASNAGYAGDGSSPAAKDQYDTIMDFLRTKTDMTPTVGIVCGSGLGGITQRLNDTITVKYTDIPGWPQCTVAGHAGELVFGTMHGNVQIVAMRGRAHGYVGHDYKKLGLGPRIMKLLGCELLVVTNAAGGINREFNVGDIMVMDDHISFPCMSGINPLVGLNDERFGPRFPPMSEAYDPKLVAHMHACAKELGLTKLMRTGCYVQVSGPNYESKAEVRLLRTIGADAVGMSTVPEVIVAAHCGFKMILGMSMITNAAILPGEDKPAANHKEVLEVIDLRTKDIQDLVSLFLKDAINVCKK
jgi:purine-nucleoside phosphorylase